MINSGILDSKVGVLNKEIHALTGYNVLVRELSVLYNKSSRRPELKDKILDIIDFLDYNQSFIRDADKERATWERTYIYLSR